MTYYRQVVERLTSIRDNTLSVSNVANQSTILDDVATVDGIVDSVLVNTSRIIFNTSSIEQQNVTLVKNLSTVHFDLETVHGVTDTILKNTSEIFEDTEYLMEEAAHESYIWPPLGHRCRLYSTASTTDFGNWTQVNSTGVNWSSLSWITRPDVGNGTCHMTAVLIEDVDTSDVIYSLEIGYGANKTSIAKHRFINPSAGRAVSCQQIRTRALGIYANTTIYYRLGCENASKYCDIGVRYHFHS